ncbi:MAG: hypothetical protein DME26_08740, partial [Verrucomicrobia bacterium]
RKTKAPTRTGNHFPAIHFSASGNGKFFGFGARYAAEVAILAPILIESLRCEHRRQRDEHLAFPGITHRMPLRESIMAPLCHEMTWK